MQGLYACSGSGGHVASNVSIQITLENLFVFIIIRAHPLPPSPSAPLLRPSHMPSNLNDNVTCSKIRDAMSLSLVFLL